MKLQLPERRTPPAPVQLNPLGDLDPIIEEAIESQPPLVASEPAPIPEPDETDEGTAPASEPPGASSTTPRSAGWVLPALAIGGIAAMLIARRAATTPTPTPTPPPVRHPPGPGHGPGQQRPAQPARRVIE